MQHIDTDRFAHPERSMNPVWSPDSRWLAYARRLDNQLRGDLRARHKFGRDPPAHRRHVRRDHAGVGRVGQVSLLPRIDQLRTQHRLAGHDLVRAAGHAHPVPGVAQRRRAFALPAAQRRGGRRRRGEWGRRRGRRRRRRKSAGSSGRHVHWRRSARGDHRLRRHRLEDHRCAGAGHGELRGARPGTGRHGVRPAGRRFRRRRLAQVLDRGARGGGLPGARRATRRFPRPRQPALLQRRMERREHRPSAFGTRRRARPRQPGGAGGSERRVRADAARRLALHARLPVRRQSARGAVGRRVGLVLGVAPRRAAPVRLQSPAGHALGRDRGRAFVCARRRLPGSGQSAHRPPGRRPGAGR